MYIQTFYRLNNDEIEQLSEPFTDKKLIARIEHLESAVAKLENINAVLSQKIEKLESRILQSAPREETAKKKSYASDPLSDFEISADGVLVKYRDRGIKYKITIPECVTRIGTSAFSGCTKLQNIQLPKSVTSIGVSAFRDCVNLLKINIPTSVTSIDFFAFSGCINLRDITIPKSVTSIDICAFTNCPNLYIHASRETKILSYSSSFHPVNISYYD